MISHTADPITQPLQIGLLVAIVVTVILFCLVAFRWQRLNRRTRFLCTLVTITVIVCIMGLLKWTVYRESIARIETERAERYTEEAVVHVADPAPDFTLTDTDGVEFSMTGVKGRVALLVFFGTWCGACARELSEIEKVWNDYGDSDRFCTLAIGRKESMSSVRDFCAKHRFSFPMAPDDTGEVFSLFATEEGVIPRTIVISPDGVVVYAKAGFYEHDAGDIRLVLTQQLARFE